MENKKPTQFLMKPKVDFCFKELMEDEEVRNAFLAAVLGIDLGEIVESRILPSHLRQKDKDDKLGILDVRVLLNNKEQIDIEIQVTARACLKIKNCTKHVFLSPFHDRIKKKGAFICQDVMN